jgi:uncharacterized membrane protein
MSRTRAARSVGRSGGVAAVAREDSGVAGEAACVAGAPGRGGGGSSSRSLRVASAAVATAGLAIAAYLTIVHYAGGEPVCAVAHGCATVQQSKYAHLAGIPVALLGLGGYLAILASLARDDEAWRTATAFLALAGFGFSAWLTYVEVVRLDAICIWCVGSAVCMTLLAGLSVARVLSAPPPGRRA